jgi:putative flippase GtrA
VLGLIIYEITLSLLLLGSATPVLLANFVAIGVSSLWNFIGADTAAFADNADRIHIGVKTIARNKPAREVNEGDN